MEKFTLAGLPHALLNIEEMNDLLGHPVIGFLFESYVASAPPPLRPPRPEEGNRDPPPPGLFPDPLPTPPDSPMEFQTFQ